jgi:hypothetical protein
VVLLLAGRHALAQQPAGSVIPMTAKDAAGATHTIHISAHPEATMEYDTKLGEFPVPPVPFPDIFDFRLLDHPDHPREPRTGCYADIRPYTSPSQADSFIVRLVTAPEAYPITIALPENLSRLCDSIVVLFPSGGEYKRAEIGRDGTWSLADPTINALLVIRHGVKGLAPKQKQKPKSGR